MSNVNDVKSRSVPMEINGKTYHLKYDLNAFAELEEKYGSIRKALDTLGGEKEKDDEGNVIMVDEVDKDGNVVLGIEGKPNRVPQRKVSIRGIRTIFWAGLIHEYPNMKEREAGALLDFSNMKYLAVKMAEAMKASMPEEDTFLDDASKKAEGAIRDTKNVEVQTP